MTTHGVPHLPPDVTGAGPAADDADATILGALAAGCVAQVVHLLGHRDDPFARLAGIDARLHTDQTDLADIYALRPFVLAGGDPVHDLWLDVLVVERLVLDGDEAAPALADRLRERLPDDLFPGLLPVYLRARAKRAAALVLLTVPDFDEPAALALRGEALTDLVRCGFQAEVAVTIVLFEAAAQFFVGEDPALRVLRIREARGLHDDVEGSVWPVLLDTVMTVAALFAGEFAAMTEALRRLDGAGPALAAAGQAFIEPFMAAMTGIGGGATVDGVVDGVDRAIDALRGSHYRLLRATQYQAAHSLADLGMARAVHYGQGARELPGTFVVQPWDNELLSMRMGLVEGTVPTSAAALALVGQVERSGRRRLAAIWAARLAGDLARAGEAATASTLRAWSLARMPPPDRQTFWEQMWLARSAEAAPTPVAAAAAAPRAHPVDPVDPVGAASVSGTGPASGATTVISVMGPVLAVEHAGRRRPVPQLAGRLLLALALAHPAPVHVETISDVLWPGIPLAKTRSRMTTALHRLRSMHAGDGGPVVREGNLLALRDGACAVDLVAYRHRLRDRRTRAAALVGVRANLCDAQFPYDDLFVEERRHFAADWLTNARAALAAGEVTLAELGPAMAALGVAHHEFAGAGSLGTGAGRGQPST